MGWVIGNDSAGPDVCSNHTFIKPEPGTVMKTRNLEALQAPREYGWKLLLSHGRGVHLQQDIEVGLEK